MFYFINIRNKLTFAKANDALVTRGDTVCRLFDLQKKIAFNADVGGCFQQINLHPLLCTMKIDNSLIIHNLHAKGHRNTIRILIALHSYSYGIASIENIKYLCLILNFSVLAPHDS